MIKDAISAFFPVLFFFFLLIYLEIKVLAGPIQMNAATSTHTHAASELDSGDPAFDTITVGSGGTALTKIKIYSATIDPSLIAAATLAEQTYTVTGLATTDVVFVNKPTATANCGIGNARVSAANTLAIQWINPLAALTCDPGSETYTILAIGQ